VIEGYPNLRDILWVQEEPKNMGAWTFMEPRLREMTNGEVPITYIGKPARPSPAQGSSRFHKEEHAGIVQAAFGSVNGDLEEAEAAAQGTQARSPGPSE
jgi:2-oxoglutarate dehydrogenase E1 component